MRPWSQELGDGNGGVPVPSTLNPGRGIPCIVHCENHSVPCGERDDYLTHRHRSVRSARSAIDRRLTPIWIVLNIGNREPIVTVYIT